MIENMSRFYWDIKLLSVFKYHKTLQEGMVINEEPKHLPSVHVNFIIEKHIISFSKRRCI